MPGTTMPMPHSTPQTSHHHTLGVTSAPSPPLSMLLTRYIHSAVSTIAIAMASHANLPRPC